MLLSAAEEITAARRSAPPPVYARLAAVTPVRYAPALASSVDELPKSESWLVGHRAQRAVPRVAAVWAFLLEEFRRFEA